MPLSVSRHLALVRRQLLPSHPNSYSLFSLLLSAWDSRFGKLLQKQKTEETQFLHRILALSILPRVLPLWLISSSSSLAKSTLFRSAVQSPIRSPAGKVNWRESCSYSRFLCRSEKAKHFRLARICSWSTVSFAGTSGNEIKWSIATEISADRKNKARYAQKSPGLALCCRQQKKVHCDLQLHNRTEEHPCSHLGWSLSCRNRSLHLMTSGCNSKMHWSFYQASA